MAKGSGMTRSGSSRGITQAPSREELQDREVTSAVSSFASMTPTRRSFESDVRANVAQLEVAPKFAESRYAKSVREGVMEGVGKMYDTYRIDPTKTISLVGENKYSNEMAATSPNGTIMRFNTAIRTRSEAVATAIHEMTHKMVGPKFEKLSSADAYTVRSIYDSAKADSSTGRGYWRTDQYEFLSETFRKALTGKSLNKYEKEAFIFIHNKFKK